MHALLVLHPCTAQGRFTGHAFKERTLWSVPGESFIADAISAVAAAHPKVRGGHLHMAWGPRCAACAWPRSLPPALPPAGAPTLCTQVSIGSYPNTDGATEDAWKVRVALRARDEGCLDAAVAALREAVPHLLAAEPSVGGGRSA